MNVSDRKVNEWKKKVDQTKQWFCNIVKPPKINVLLVQRKTDRFDCSIFTIGYLRLIVSERKTIVNVKLSTFKMRAQKLCCLLKKTITKHFSPLETLIKRYLQNTNTLLFL